MQNSERQHLQIEELKAKTERKHHKYYAAGYISKFLTYSIISTLTGFLKCLSYTEELKKKYETQSSADDGCTRSYESLVNFYQLSSRHIPDNSNFQRRTFLFGTKKHISVLLKIIAICLDTPLLRISLV